MGMENKVSFTKTTLSRLTAYNELMANTRPLYPEKDFPIYEGPLDRKKMPKLARIAYESYNGQKAKCNNPRNHFYSTYGAKGIRVKYSPREFIGWWLYSLGKFSGTKAVCARRDHDKDYCWENIFMCDSSLNSLESMVRTVNRTAPKTMIGVVAIDPKTNQQVASYSSVRDAARQLGVSQRLIQFNIRGKIPLLKKMGWKLQIAGGKIGDASTVSDSKKRNQKHRRFTGILEGQRG